MQGWLLCEMYASAKFFSNKTLFLTTIKKPNMSAMTSPSSSEEFRKSRFAGGKLEAGLGSLRRRDSSWDKKWQEHVVRTSVDMPRQIPRLSRTPCKINGPNAIGYNTVSKKKIY